MFPGDRSHIVPQRRDVTKVPATTGVRPLHPPSRRACGGGELHAYKEVRMSAVERRETRGLLPDLLDWMESPFAALRPSAAKMIRVEEFLEEDAYVVRAELPDVDPDKDVEITVTGDLLQIRAERREERKDAHRSEFHYGSFSRAFTLPREVRAEDITASYDKGILTIKVPMPKAGEREAKRV